MLKAMLLVLLAAAMVNAEDSPLVALAKRTNRKASTTPVITNETLARSKGRLSMPAGDTPPPSTAQSNWLSSSATSRPATPNRPSSQNRSAAAPAATAAATTAPSYPPSSARNVEPQSSVPVVTPQSTARTIQPSSGAGRIDPQSTAQTIRPESSAQNIPPQSSTPPQ